MGRIFGIIGSVSALLGVAAGAFGAHGLKQTLTPEMLDVFEVGARYQMYHAFALLAVAMLAMRTQSKLVNAAGWLYVAGTVIFSGSLYVLAMSGIKWLGAITPIGGLCFMIGWATLAVGFAKCGTESE